jgi:hypothetical protein
MSAFNTPFQRGQGLSNQGIPSPSQFRPTPDSAVADAVSRAGVSIAQQAIRNQREEERQKQLEDQQEQRLAVRRATAEAQEAKAALGRQLSEGQITHDQYFAESSSLLDNTKSTFEDLAKTYPDAQAVMDIASLEVANGLNNTTSGIRVQYLEDQAYQNATEDIEQLSEGMQVFRPDSQTGENIFFIEPFIERLEMIRSQIDADTALSARDKRSLVSDLEQSTIFTVVNQLTASGKVTPEAINEVKRMTQNEVLLRSLDKIQRDALETQEETRAANALRDYGEIETEEFAKFQRTPTADVLSLYINLRDSAIGLGYEYDNDDLVKKTLRAVDTRLAASDYEETVQSGRVLNADDLGQLASMESQIEILLEETAYTATKDGTSILRTIAGIRQKSIENKKTGSMADSTFFETGRYKRNTPEQVLAAAAMTARDIETGAWHEKAARGYELHSAIEPEYEQHINKLATDGNVQELSRMFSMFGSDALRSSFALKYPLDTQQGLMIALAATLPESEVIEIAGNERVMSNVLQIAKRHLGEKGPQAQARDKALKNAAKDEGFTFDDLEAQRYKVFVFGTGAFSDVDGNEFDLMSAGTFAQIEPEHSLFLFSHMAKIVDDVGPEAAYAAAFDHANKKVAERHVFISNTDGTKSAVLISRSQTGLSDNSLKGFAAQTRAAAGGDDTLGQPDFDGLVLITDRGGERYIATPMIDRTTGLTTHMAIQPYADFGLATDGGTRFDTPNWITRASLWVQGRLSEEKKNWTKESADEQVVGVALMTMNEFKANYPTSTRAGENEFRDPDQLFVIDPTFNVKTDLPNVGGMTLNPRLLWNDSLYRSNEFGNLTPRAQARIRAMARETARIDNPDLDDIALSFITEQVIINHGWKIK